MCGAILLFFSHTKELCTGALTYDCCCSVVEVFTDRFFLCSASVGLLCMNNGYRKRVWSSSDDHFLNMILRCSRCGIMCLYFSMDPAPTEDWIYGFHKMFHPLQYTIMPCLDILKAGRHYPWCKTIPRTMNALLAMGGDPMQHGYCLLLNLDIP